VQVHHALLHSALKAAVKSGLVTRNVAALVSNKPKKVARQDVLDHVWTADEAAKFLKVANAVGSQPAAFYTLALDSGARKGELAALRWADVDLAAGTLLVQRTLLKGGREPVFGPTKSKMVRKLEPSAETMALLRAHKSHQAEIKLRNRQQYRDLGLVFAKEWGDVHGREDSLGGPLQVNTIGQREFDRLIKAAGVKRIKFHGMRHTVATLMLSAGVPAHVVQRRLGHSKIEMTLGIYALALPTMQQDAASRLAALLHR
jgi:integrase